MLIQVMMVGRRKSIHFDRSHARNGLFREKEHVWSLFHGSPTRFWRKMAGIRGCVYCLHAICRDSPIRERNDFALPLVDRLSLAELFHGRMYDQHTTRNSCHFSPESCFGRSPATPTVHHCIARPCSLEPIIFIYVL